MSTTPLPKIGAPATRALDAAGVTSLEGLAWMTRRELEELHGMGPKAIRLLDAALAEAGLQLQPPAPEDEESVSE